MNNAYIQVFAAATCNVLAQLGSEAKHQNEISEPDSIFSKYNVLVIIGLATDIRGSVIYSMDTQTAQELASTMMGGVPLEGIDDMAKSAICEFANMATGASIAALAKDLKIDITPPTLVSGQKMSIMVGLDKVLKTELITPHGGIEVYLGVQS